MKPSDIRNHISQQCGFNKAKQGVWDEKSQTYIKPSGTVQQGRRPMFKPFPTKFSEWLEQNQDSIEMPLDRTEATCQWFDNKAKNEPLPF